MLKQATGYLWMIMLIYVTIAVMFPKESACTVVGILIFGFVLPTFAYGWLKRPSQRVLNLEAKKAKETQGT